MIWYFLQRPRLRPTSCWKSQCNSFSVRVCLWTWRKAPHTDNEEDTSCSFKVAVEAGSDKMMYSAELQILVVTIKVKNRAIRMIVRNILYLPRTSLDVHVHTTIRKEKLGVLSMWAHVPIILRNRYAKILTLNDPVNQSIGRLGYVIKLQEKLDCWTVPDGHLKNHFAWCQK